MGQGAFSGFDNGMGQAEPHVKGYPLTIGMDQFTEDAPVTGLKIRTFLEVFDKNQWESFAFEF